MVRGPDPDVSVDVQVVARLPCQILEDGELLPVTWHHQRTNQVVGRLQDPDCQDCRAYVETDGTLVLNLPVENDFGIWACISPGREWTRTNVTVTGM